MLNYFYKGLWPLTWFIASLPPSLRHLLHVGMHVAALDSGNRAATEALSCELLDLWETGISGYQVAVIIFNMDTKGYEFFRGQQGTGSYSGCYDCKGDTGSYVCGRMVHKCHRRFLPKNSIFRRKSASIYNQNLPFFNENETRDSIPNLNYNDYIRFSDQYVENGRVSAVQGCKEPWCFRNLPYAFYIATVTDPMHILGNVIGDSILILKPGTAIKSNRSANPSIIEYENDTNNRFYQGFIL